MAKIKGICKNFQEDCEMAIRQKEQEADSNHFVCSRCNKPLTKIGEKKPPITIIIAAIVLVAALILAVLLYPKNEEVSVNIPEPTVIEEGQGSETVEPGNLNVRDTTKILTNPVPEEKKETTIKESEGKTPSVTPKKVDPTPDSGTINQAINLGFGTFKPEKNGIGTVIITRNIDFPSNQGTVTAQKGDKIVDAKVKNGRLVMGKLVKKNGGSYILKLGV